MFEFIIKTLFIALVAVIGYWVIVKVTFRESLKVVDEIIKSYQE